MRCCGCAEDFPDTTGPTHAYMLSSPGCWEAYGRLLVRDYENPGYGGVHRLSVDAYAVQHPGVDVPQARNSVGIHVSRLCLKFHYGWPMSRIDSVMDAIIARKRAYPWLTPPCDRGAVTVKHVLASENASAHLHAVESWAQSAWQAWAEHHGTVLKWLESVSNR